MSTSQYGSKTHQSAMRSGLYETETQRLQKEADNFTKKLEQEKRALVFLEDQHKEEEKKLKETKERLREIRPSTQAQKRNVAKLKALENQLDKAIVKYNQLLSENVNLKKQIDAQRKEKLSSDMVAERLTKEISGMDKTVEKLNNQCIDDEDRVKETNLQIMVLSNKHTREKEEFNEQIVRLKDKLKEREDLRKVDERGHAKDIFPPAGGGKTAQRQEFSNPLEILNQRLEKWKASNARKKEILAQYQRNVRIIQDAFDQIQEATGISEIEEIVSTFIKSSEQEYNLLTYLNSLNQDIENMKEIRKTIQENIQTKQIQGEKSATEKNETVNNLKDQLDLMKANLEAKEEDIKKIEEEMSQIQTPITEMMHQFKSSKISLSVASNMDYDENTVFTEKNIIAYLAEVEEYISSLLALIAQKHELQNPLLSALHLENMESKRAYSPRALRLAEAPRPGDDTDMNDGLLIDEGLMFDKNKMYNYYQTLDNKASRGRTGEESKRATAMSGTREKPGSAAKQEKKEEVGSKEKEEENKEKEEETFDREEEEEKKAEEPIKDSKMDEEKETDPKPE